MARGKYLIIGMGQLGQVLLDALLDAHAEILVVDSKEEKIRQIQDKVRNTVVLDATNAEVLRKFDLETFDAAIVTMGEQFQNILLISVLLKELGVKKVIARASSKLEERLLKKIGVDIVIFPEVEMGKKLANMLLRKSVEEVIPLADDNSIINVKVPDVFIGKPLSRLRLRRNYSINVIAVKNLENERENMLIPNSSYVFKKDDTLIIIGENDNIDRFTRDCLQSGL